VGQLLQLASSIVLARLLTPREFGLAATVYLFAGVASLLAEMGIGSAVVRKRDLRAVDVATAFWANALGGVALTVLLVALSPAIARIYDSPELVGLMWLIALRFCLSLHVVPLALLERSMDFSRIARIDVLAFVLGATAAIAAAFAGFGAYSLVIGPLVQATVQSTLFMWTARFVPRSFIDRRAAADLWAYSSRYTAANLISYFRYNADGFLVGKVLGQEQLGYYGRGMVLVSLPLQQLTYVLHRVMLPVFTRLRDDDARLRWGYGVSLGGIAVLAGSGLSFVAAAADDIVPVVWGDQWRPVIPVVLWLAVAGWFQVLSSPTGWLAELEGRTGLLLKLTVFTASTTVVGLVIGVQDGIVGVARALAVTGAINLVPSLWLAAHLLSTSVLGGLRALVPGIAAAAAVAAAVTGVDAATTGLPVPVELLLKAAAACIAVVVTVPVVDRVCGTGLVAAARVLAGRTAA
jgi:PST family polysaccharide transporter